jgi:hypothetical protein
LSLAYCWGGVLYALANGQPASPTSAVAGTLVAAGAGLVELGRFSSWALPVTLGLCTAAVDALALGATGRAARAYSAFGTLLGGLAAWFALCTALVLYQPLARTESIAGLSALLAAVVAVAAHSSNRGLVGANKHDAAWGARFGRDVLLLSVGASIVAVLGTIASPSSATLTASAAALALSVGVCLHAAWRERAARHVYLAQVAAVGAYALVRTLSRGTVPPESDALFALVLGFFLVGITVWAKRHEMVPVERATRRFAALLPIALVFILPFGPSRTAALFAVGSGALYGTLAAVSQRKWYGVLAAIAGNGALLIAMLSEGMVGAEIYIGPLGVLLLCLAQLFSEELPQASRNALRVIGGLLLYAPAAVKLSFQLGQAADESYALAFAGICAVGIVAGMLMQVRAFLVLGTLFLTLDVAATVTQAGLRDRSVGFAALTGTGLLILGTMVLFTVRRDELSRRWSSVRARLQGWE